MKGLSYHIKCFWSKSVICFDSFMKMAEKMKSRSSTTKEIFNEIFVEVSELKSTGKLPTGKKSHR